MAERIHIVVDHAEKERFRQLAAREGKSLSQWLRDAAHEKLVTAESKYSLKTRQALEQFFAECDRRERGEEPEWEAHLQVIAESIADGRSQT